MFNYSSSFCFIEFFHDLINLHLYPDRIYRVGQSDFYPFRDAEIIVERVGNTYGTNKAAISYRYCFSYAGYNLYLLAVWEDEDCATAEVRLLGELPVGDEALETIREWLQENVTGRGSRSVFDNDRC